MTSSAVNEPNILATHMDRHPAVTPKELHAQIHSHYFQSAADGRDELVSVQSIEQHYREKTAESKGAIRRRHSGRILWRWIVVVTVLFEMTEDEANQLLAQKAVDPLTELPQLLTDPRDYEKIWKYWIDRGVISEENVEKPPDSTPRAMDRLADAEKASASNAKLDDGHKSDVQNDSLIDVRKSKTDNSGQGNTPTGASLRFLVFAILLILIVGALGFMALRPSSGDDAASTAMPTVAPSASPNDVEGVTAEIVPPATVNREAELTLPPSEDAPTAATGGSGVDSIASLPLSPSEHCDPPHAGEEEVSVAPTLAGDFEIVGPAYRLTNDEPHHANVRLRNDRPQGDPRFAFWDSRNDIWLRSLDDRSFLAPIDQDGSWRLRVGLAPGRYCLRFWIVDVENRGDNVMWSYPFVVGDGNATIPELPIRRDRISTASLIDQPENGHTFVDARSGDPVLLRLKPEPEIKELTLINVTTRKEVLGLPEPRLLTNDHELSLLPGDYELTVTSAVGGIDVHPFTILPGE